MLPCLLAVLGPPGHARESGRVDPQSGQVLPWPWTVNREGDGRLFETSGAAVAYVAAARRAGSVSMDVGCFQINLKHHPDAFATLQQALDPAANAAYAARFLAELHAQTGSWQAAVARYHSATPDRGLPYRDAVMATWRGMPNADMALASGRVSAEPYREVMGIRVWTPHVGLSGPVIIPVSSGIAKPLPETLRTAESRLPRAHP